MAQEGTEQTQEPAGQEGAHTGGDGRADTGQEGTGRHAAAEEPATGAQQPAATGEGAAETSAPAAQGAEKSAPAENATEKSAPAERTTEKVAPAEAPTEKAAPAEAPTERQAAPAAAPPRGQADPSRGEPEREPAGTPRHRSIDVGELAWRTGNVLATVVRTLALLFALVLVVNVVLVLVGVNPANGVAEFVGAVANIVILGFRDLFVPANPVVMLVVNSLIAAVFWAFVGELVSRVVRFLAARVS